MVFSKWWWWGNDSAGNGGVHGYGALEVRHSGADVGDASGGGSHDCGVVGGSVASGCGEVEWRPVGANGQELE